MVAFPLAKINLGLYITEKRSDGYHNLSTIFLPVLLRDAIECIIAPPTQKEDVLFSSSGLPIAGAIEDNLCVRAWHLLKKQDPSLPRVQMHLHKNIPMGAGMGGGSADGSYMLLLLQQCCRLNLSAATLASLALQLGSDCPFFLHPVPSLAGGRGELLEPIEVPLRGYKIWLLHPGVHVSTAAAFAQIQPKPLTVSLAELIQAPISTWQKNIHNQFEEAVFNLHPSLAAVKQAIYDAGAVYAAMTGSGSTLYGIFPPDATCPTTTPAGCTSQWVDVVI